MPDEFPDDENGDTLRRMRAQGDDLSVSRLIDFSLLFEDEASARKFCAQIASDDFKCACAPLDDEFGEAWDVTVSFDMVPTHGAVTEMEAFLAEMAAPLQGENDGWGCFSQAGP
jgi:hypothetical protein